jgi:hypothetical protein
LVRGVGEHRSSGNVLSRRIHGNYDMPYMYPIQFSDPGAWLLVPPCYTRRCTLFFLDIMSHAVDHALRNAPLDKPHPPWLQQLQAQWQAAKHALGSTRGSPSKPAPVDGSRPSQGKFPRRKSSLHSLKEALLQTKDTLLAAIRMLPRKHGDGSDDSWVYRLLERFGSDTYKHLTDII